MFEEWCDGRRLESYQCSVSDISCFLEDPIVKGKSFSTTKVYLAVVAACHVGFNGTLVGQRPLNRRFMKGAAISFLCLLRLCQDFSVVLEVLSHQLFEPLGDVSLNQLSFQTALCPSQCFVCTLCSFLVH